MGQVFTAVTAGQGNGVGLSLYTFGRLNFFSCRCMPPATLPLPSLRLQQQTERKTRRPLDFSEGEGGGGEQLGANIGQVWSES